jgi:hypothetical protein
MLGSLWIERTPISPESLLKLAVLGERLEPPCDSAHPLTKGWGSKYEGSHPEIVGIGVFKLGRNDGIAGLGAQQSNDLRFQ